MTEIYDSYPDISIHAPRAGGDAVCRLFAAQIFISIHAPRAGGDETYTQRRYSRF